MIVGSAALIFTSIALANEVWRKPELAAAGGGSMKDEAKSQIGERIHMDLESDTGHLPRHTVAIRGLIFFGWLLAFMGSMATIGLIPTVPLFVVLYMRLEGPEPWRLVIPQAVGLTVFIWFVFDQLLTIPWPQTLLGQAFPALKALVPSM